MSTQPTEAGCVASYHHEPHADCPGRDETTCMETTCYKPHTTGFTGCKSGRDDVAYRTCAVHKIPLAFGLVRFGLIETAVFR